MKKINKRDEGSELREEYDFAGAVRGKHYQAYRAGHTVRIQKATGATQIHYFTKEDGAVILDPDIKTHFPTSTAVNRALRAVLAHG